MRRPRHLSATGLAFLLAALAMVSPFSIDTFFPSFQAIEAEFGITRLEMQQTLTAYMLPYAFMSLVYGPVSDAFGRRSVIIVCLALYAIASIACALAPSFGSLLAFRAAQGATAGSGFAVGRAIVRDVHAGPHAQRLMSLITMIFGIAPAVAPVIGGWIQVVWGWRAVFVFLMLIGLALMVAAWVRLPETHPRERRVPFHVGSLMAAAWRIGLEREFLLLSIALGFNFAASVLYIGAAPAIVLEHWHLSETQFAHLFIPVIGGFVGGAFLSGRLAGRLPTDTQVEIGLSISLAAAITMAAMQSAMQVAPVLAQQALIFAVAFGAQLIMPVVTLRLLDLHPRNRGTVSSVQAFVAILINACVMGVAAPILGASMDSLAYGALAAAALAWALWRVAPRHPLPADAVPPEPEQPPGV